MLDNRQTFAEYAAYVLELKERSGTKSKTIDRYRELMGRINQAIGHMKLADIRPQHLNSFYKNLSEPGIRETEGIATARIDLAAWLKANKKSRAGIAKAAGVGASTVSTAAQGHPIRETKARATPHNCACESQPSFCPTSAVPKMGNIAQPLPAQAGLRMRHTPCGYIQYSFVFQTLNWDKNPV